ncbi:centrosome-associated protein 350 [Patella vulgata]|uniref:centrosome-associated protein 350 n=1 Tax=Patella vulgata TaxID=6465 RepID=UPI0024A992FD|nr:centrosome-associated protein 350 [Patella vulgata]
MTEEVVTQTHQREQKTFLRQSTEEDLDEEDEDDFGVKPIHHLDDDPHDSDDFQEFESFQSQQTRTQGSVNNMTHSSTNDSLVEGQTKSYTPSMTSSGYASQAVSTLTLSSEDSMSVKSMEEQADGKNNKMRQKSASTETSSESDSEERGNKNNNSKDVSAPEQVDEDQQISNENLKNRRSDSLLDEGVPDIPGSPLKPIPSPPITSDPFFKETNEAENKNSEKKPNVSNQTKKPIITRPKLPVFEDHVTLDNKSAICNVPDNDLYSVNALEELEKLQDTCEETEDLSPPIADESHLNKPIADESHLNKPINEQISANNLESTNKTPVKPLVIDHEVKSLDRADVLRRKGSAGRPRPVSCVGSPQTYSVHRGMPLDPDRRSSLHFTDEQVQGFDDSMSECSFGSRADLDRLMDIPVPSWIQEGEGVTVTSSRGTVPKSGLVRFVGQVDFAAGNWIGVELDQPEGKNDGSVNKQRYFKCRSRHGIFVRPDKLIWDKKRKGTKNLNNSATSRRSSSGLAHSSSNSNLSASKSKTAGSKKK